MAVWQPQVLDCQQPGGWALAHCRQHFLTDSNGVLFPREWLKKQDLPVVAEHGLGYFKGDAVYLLELSQPQDMPGCFWQGLRQFMLQGDDDETFRLLSYAAQTATWAAGHR
nr:NAD(+) diphosphatase [Pseudomonas sp.]